MYIEIICVIKHTAIVSINTRKHIANIIYSEPINGDS